MYRVPSVLRIQRPCKVDKYYCKWGSEDERMACLRLPGEIIAEMRLEPGAYNLVA